MTDSSLRLTLEDTARHWRREIRSVRAAALNESRRRLRLPFSACRFFDRFFSRPRQGPFLGPALTAITPTAGALLDECRQHATPTHSGEYPNHGQRLRQGYEYLVRGNAWVAPPLLRQCHALRSPLDFVTQLMSIQSPDDSSPKSTCFRHDEWQALASARLQTLLTANRLRRLVGDFELGLRASRRAESGHDRPSNQGELADALLIAHDTDLLAQRDVRDALTEAVNSKTDSVVENPKRWLPGHAAAKRFVRAIALPFELAGTRAPEQPSSILFVMPPAPHKRLEPYQQQVSDAMSERLNADPPDNRAIVSLPTGAGKTRVAVETLHKWAHDRLNEGDASNVTLVWLAHTEELCEQAIECFDEVWRSNPNGHTSIGLVRYWGNFRHRLDETETADSFSDTPIRALVSTPQSFIRIDGSVEMGILEDSPDAIVIDEAHRAASTTYRRIVERHGNDSPVIGLTATPYRREFDRKDPERGTRDLKSLFRHLIVAESLGAEPLTRLHTLQDMNVLSRPISQTVPTRLNLNVGNPPASDNFQETFNFDQELSRAADQTRRRRVVINTIEDTLERSSSAQLLYFGPSVRDAELVAFMLRAKGKRAAAVSGATRQGTRRTIINDFKLGRVDILCNCEVLTTGFDAPRVTHVVMARPTVSQVLYEQMVGRGLRGPKFGGTDHCIIIDFEDGYRGRRPVLGYEFFRDVWQPEVLETTQPNEDIGLLLQLGVSEAIRIARNEGGIAQCRFKPATRSGRMPLQMSLEGDGTGMLRVSVLDPQAGALVSVREISLPSKDTLVAHDVSLTIGQQLILEAQTADRGSHIEVRRRVT